MLEKLRPHQLAPFHKLSSVLKEFGSGVDQSSTGTGKTYVGAAVAIASREPTLVVCPKVARSAWERAAEYLGEKLSVVNYEMLRAGNTQFGKWSAGKVETVRVLVCENCQCRVDPVKPTPCPHHPRGIHCVATKKLPRKYGRFSFHPGVRQVIFDEVHRCNSTDSLNADILIAAKRESKKVLGLSATMAHSPIQFRALGYLLDVHNLDSDLTEAARIGLRLVRPSFKHWLSAAGCRFDPVFHGWKWFAGQEEQARIMSEIRASISDRSVRVTPDDIPGFPERDIQAELYTLDHPEKIDGCYTKMRHALEELKERSGGDVDPEHPLTKILRARQEVELLKVPIFAELAQDYLDKGFSVGCFVNFRQTIDELTKLFPSYGIIDGQTKDRDGVIDRFQANLLRIIFVNSEAGGVALSLHDKLGGFPRVGLVSPGFSAVTLRQVFGRFQREGGRSRSIYRVIFADKTVEVPVWRAVAPKLNNIDALTDGDLAPEGINVSRYAHQLN
jgi:hypothetical protein